MRWSGSAAGRCRIAGPAAAGRPGGVGRLLCQLREDTGWSPRFDAMDDIVRTAWDWHSTHPKGFDDRG